MRGVRRAELFLVRERDIASLHKSNGIWAEETAAKPTEARSLSRHKQNRDYFRTERSQKEEPKANRNRKNPRSAEQGIGPRANPCNETTSRGREQRRNPGLEASICEYSACSSRQRASPPSRWQSPSDCRSTNLRARKSPRRATRPRHRSYIPKGSCSARPCSATRRRTKAAW